MKRARTAVVLAALLLMVLPTGPVAAQETPEARQSDNVTLVDHIPYQLGTDMQFQRREGTQVLDGVEVDGPRDYLFAGNDASNASDIDGPEGGIGLRIFDVTEPTDIQQIAGIACTGYHSDVAVHENLLVQSIDSAGSNHGCDAAVDPDGKDVKEKAGVRIFDVSDPANPVVAGFVSEDDLGGSVHNITIVPWADLLYIAGSDFTRGDPRMAIVDLSDPAFPATVIPMNDISPSATAECHDIGLDPERQLAFCAAVEQTFVWDISDPMAPTNVSTIVNPDISIHHGARLAPDGTTLVLNDELAGAAAAFGCLGTGSAGLVGALWFYDLSDPANPTPQGSYSTEELNPTDQPCTSHFYGFIPGTTLVTVGWYRSGIVVVDYENPMQPTTHAFYDPAGGDFWSAYYWHGYVYGNAFRFDSADESPGLWVIGVDDLPDVAPAAADEGLTWGRWTGAPDGGTDGSSSSGSGSTGGTGAGSPSLPTTGGGVALMGLVAIAGAALARRQRR